jgi:hypothetical protein
MFYHGRHIKQPQTQKKMSGEENRVSDEEEGGNDPDEEYNPSCDDNTPPNPGKKPNPVVREAFYCQTPKGSRLSTPETGGKSGKGEDRHH